MAKVMRRQPPGKAKRPATVIESSKELSLPDAPSIPSTRFSDYSWLIFGEKKIGKTTLCSLLPNAVFLMAEPGGRALSIYQRPITTWSQYLGYLKLLKEDTRFENVVVDTIDMLFKFAEKQALQRLGIDDPSEEAWGKGWRAIRDTFTPGIQQLLSLDKGIFLISHSVEREIKTRSGQKYDRIQPTMANTARDLVEAMVDVWAYYHYDGKERYLQVKGDDHVAAGHRLQEDHFRYKGKELERIWMGRTKEESYKNLVDAFGNVYVPPSFAQEEDETPKKPLSLKRRA